MGDVAVNVDLTGLDRAILRYVEELGIEGAKVVKNTGRLLAAELLRLTPPKSYAQGRAAVERDINRAMWSLDPAKIHNKVLRTAVQDQEFDVVQAFLNALQRTGKSGAFAGYRLEHFSPELHRRARDRRGRVQRSQKIIVLERAEHKRYVKEIQGHVGSTKFGWGIGAQRLGVNVPSWVLGHNPALGSYEENLKGLDPMLAMTNRGPGLDGVAQSIIRQAVSRREKAMARDVDRMLAGGASKYFD